MTITLLTDEQLISFIQGAFTPLRCAAKFGDYRKVVAFRVFGPNDEVIVEMKSLNAALAKNEPYLKATLSSVRQRVEEKGFSLEHWPHD